MLSLKAADLYADFTINRQQFDRDLSRIKKDLGTIAKSKIDVKFNTGNATRSVDSLTKRVNALNQAMGRAASTRLNVMTRGGGGGGGRGGGFASGVGMGLGLPGGSPGMVAGSLLGTGLEIAGGASLRAFADVEARLTDIRRVAGLSADEADRLKGALMNMGQMRPGNSVMDLLGMAETGGRAGVRGGAEGLAAFAGDVAMVRNVIQDMDPGQLSDQMVRMLGVFEQGTDKVRSMGSALAALDSETTASAGEILNISTRLSGAAHAMGMTAQETMALAAGLRNAGLTAEVAGTAFSQILRKMATDRDKFAGVLGIDPKEFEAQIRRGPMEALQTVLTKLHEVKDTLGGIDLIESLGLRGQRTGGGLLQLAATVEKLGPLLNTANDQWTKQTALLEANTLKTNTYWASVQRLENAWTALAETLGKKVAPAAQGVMNILGLGLHGLNVMAGGAPNLNQQIGQGIRGQIRGAIGAVAGAKPAAPAGAAGPPGPASGIWEGLGSLLGGGRAAGGAAGRFGGLQAGLFGLQGKPALNAIWEGMTGASKLQMQQTRNYGIESSGSQFGRRLDEQLLNLGGDKDKNKEIADNTKVAGEGVKQIVGLIQRAMNSPIARAAAVLGR